MPIRVARHMGLEHPVQAVRFPQQPHWEQRRVSYLWTRCRSSEKQVRATRQNMVHLQEVSSLSPLVRAQTSPTAQHSITCGTTISMPTIGLMITWESRLQHSDKMISEEHSADPYGFRISTT